MLLVHQAHFQFEARSSCQSMNVICALYETVLGFHSRVDNLLNRTQFEDGTTLDATLAFHMTRSGDSRRCPPGSSRPFLRRTWRVCLIHSLSQSKASDDHLVSVALTCQTGRKVSPGSSTMFRLRNPCSEGIHKCSKVQCREDSSEEVQSFARKCCSLSVRECGGCTQIDDSVSAINSPIIVISV